MAVPAPEMPSRTSAARSEASLDLPPFEQQDQACLIYEGSGNQLAVAAPFLQQGLARGECCIYVLDDATPAELTASLRAEGVDVETELARGALVQISGTDFGPGNESVELWLAGLAAIVSRAKSDGFAGLRVAVDMTWALTRGLETSVVEHIEALANPLFYKERPVVGLCQYNRDRFTAEMLATALATHPIAVVEGVVYRNPHYQPPGVLFGALSPRERVQWMLDDLKSRHREQQQREQVIRSEAAARSREEFLATAAHELRTPVTSIRGFLQLALRHMNAASPPDLPRLREMLAVADAQSERLTRLVAQLFDLSAIETGKMSLHRQPCDLAALTRQSVHAVKLAAEEHRFQVHAPDALVLEVDELRLSRVLTNLLDNAVKYSPAGSLIEIDLSATADAAARIAVRDHGVGVPETRRSSLFERFYQAHHGASGMGLGLYVSRQIVERHGGRLTAEFPEDGGARFVIALPPPGAVAIEEEVRLP